MKIHKVKDGGMSTGLYYAEWTEGTKQDAWYDSSTNNWYDSASKLAEFKIPPAYAIEIGAKRNLSISNFLLQERKLENLQAFVDNEFAKLKAKAIEVARLENLVFNGVMSQDEPSREVYELFEKVEREARDDSFYKGGEITPPKPDIHQDNLDYSQRNEMIKRWNYDCFIAMWRHLKQKS